MVLPWPGHSCLHLFLGILDQHYSPSPVPQKPSCCPLRSIDRISQAQVNQRAQGNTVAEKALKDGSEGANFTSASHLSDILCHSKMPRPELLVSQGYSTIALACGRSQGDPVPNLTHTWGLTYHSPFDSWNVSVLYRWIFLRIITSLGSDPQPMPLFPEHVC